MSTKEDIAPESSSGITSYLKKKCKYGYIVLEHSPETLRLHLHACVCFKVKIEKKHMEESVWKHVYPHHRDSIKIYALKSTVQYNDKWLTEYLQKDSSKEVLWHDIGSDYSLFYPSKEEQEQLIAAKKVGRPVSSDAKDPWMAKHEMQWEEYAPSDDSYKSAYRYLSYQINVARTMPAIRDERRLCDAAWALHRYRTHAIEPTTYALNYEHQKTGGGHSYT